MPKPPLPAVAAIVALTLGISGAGVVAWDLAAARLQSELAGGAADGIEESQLAPIAAQLEKRRAARVGVLPAALLPFALFRDPFADLDRRYRAVYAADQERAADRAQAALADLRQARGGAPSSYRGEEAAYAAALTPADYDRLAHEWRLEAEAARAERDALGQAAGGFQEGRPQDLADLAARLDDAASRAASAGLSADPVPRLREELAAYLTLSVGDQLAEHALVRDDLQAGLAVLQHRLDSHQHAQGLLAALSNLEDLARTVGIPPEVEAQVKDARGSVDQAADDGALEAANQKLQAVSDVLNAIINRSPSAPLPPCLQPGAPAKEIIVHLATQQLVAYDGGCPWLATPVTTGRPALPTGRGTFHIFYKAYAYKMISPWPPGSPFWYPDTWVSYAMEFIGDGTFLHTADWQPENAYGPGSQYGPYASHGCVHVMDGPAARLFAWAPIGTTVVVED